MQLKKVQIALTECGVGQSHQAELSKKELLIIYVLGLCELLLTASRVYQCQYFYVYIY